MLQLSYLTLFLSALTVALKTTASPVPGMPITTPVPVGGAPRNVNTPYGTAKGAATVNGVTRYVVKYASASRWQPSTASTTWIMPGNDPTKMPPACPQPDLSASQYSEDCLYMVLYVPTAAPSINPSLSTFTWLHGGSFYFGSASNDGLDGSALAVATSSIVAIPQYRLGALGFLPDPSHSSNSNLAAKDIVQALKFLHAILPSFGGDPSQVTLAGQSSGAKMVEAMMVAPSAQSYFAKAVLHSVVTFDTFLPSSSLTILQNAFFANISCTPPVPARPASLNYPGCLTATPLATILNSQVNLYAEAATLTPAAGSSEPLRPTTDSTNFLTSTLSGNSWPSPLKPLLFTNVKNEAGQVIGSNLWEGFPTDYYSPTVEATFGENRTDVLLAAPYYNLNNFPGDDTTREALELMGTDASWRCGGWMLARGYAGKGGSVHTGMFVQGATYTSNADIDYCAGRVCHEDDIYIVFGTTPSATAAQTALTTEIQARWKGFIKSSSPQATGYPNWVATTSSNPHVLLLGGSGEDAVGACDPTFWGQQVQFDWQIFGQ